jgi:hypothetical protein
MRAREGDRLTRTGVVLAYESGLVEPGEAGPDSALRRQDAAGEAPADPVGEHLEAFPLHVVELRLAGLELQLELVPLGGLLLVGHPVVGGAGLYGTTRTDPQLDAIRAQAAHDAAEMALWCRWAEELGTEDGFQPWLAEPSPSRPGSTRLDALVMDEEEIRAEMDVEIAARRGGALPEG